MGGRLPYSADAYREAARINNARNVWAVCAVGFAAVRTSRRTMFGAFVLELKKRRTEAVRGDEDGSVRPDKRGQRKVSLITRQSFHAPCAKSG